MSDVAIGGQRESAPFRGRTVVLMLALGILGFLGTLVLGAYAPDLKSGRNGGAHALSTGATGFAALVELARATGRNPRVLRNTLQFDTENLLVVTPEHGATDISAALRGREAKPTLFIFPKWRTVADQKRRGWVHAAGLVPIFEPVGVLAPGVDFAMTRHRTRGELLASPDPLLNGRFRAPKIAQVITGFAKGGNRGGQKLQPLLIDGRGGILLAQLGEGPLYVLADPDLLNNIGMRDLDQAAAALALLDWMNSNPPDSVAFDVSFNGFGQSKSPLKLLFEPPFLALSIGIAAALALAGWQAFARFGPIAPRERAIGFGKATLVDNSAALVRKAGREARMGGRYAAIIRERAARTFGAPARLKDAALDQYLDALKGRDRFTDLVQRAEAARDRNELLEAAQALHAWQADKMETIK